MNITKEELINDVLNDKYKYSANTVKIILMLIELEDSIINYPKLKHDMKNNALYNKLFIYNTYYRNLKLLNKTNLNEKNIESSISNELNNASIEYVLYDEIKSNLLKCFITQSNGIQNQNLNISFLSYEEQLKFYTYMIRAVNLRIKYFKNAFEDVVKQDILLLELLEKKLNLLQKHGMSCQEIFNLSKNTILNDIKLKEEDFKIAENSYDNEYISKEQSKSNKVKKIGSININLIQKW